MYKDHNFVGTGGIIENVFSYEEMDKWKSFFEKIPPYISERESQGNILHCVTEKHAVYKWFEAKVFKQLQDLLHADMRTVIAFYSSIDTAWEAHTDNYHQLPEGAQRYCMSILIPYSVDNDKNKTNLAHTVLFNELYINDQLIENQNPVRDFDLDPYLTDHIRNRDLLNKLTPRTVLHWSPGSVIYWDTNLMHCSGNFGNSYNDKQAFVIHTYL